MDATDAQNASPASVVQGATRTAVVQDAHDHTCAQSALEFRGFGFGYSGEAEVLRDLDWRVESGSFHLLTGATGSGKTTLLRCCKPAVAPIGERRGSVLVFDRPLDSFDDYQVASQIGYVAQSPENQIVCDVVWHELAFGLENMGMPQQQMRRRVAEVAHFFGIEPWIRRSVTDLSGGQKQLVNLAAALALCPRILLLDEPTAQLDPVAEKNFLHALFRVNRELGLTVIVATHAPESMVAYATAASWLEDGHISALPLTVFAHDLADTTAAAACSTAATAPVADKATAAIAEADDADKATLTAGFAADIAHPAASSSAAPAVHMSDVFFRYRRGEDWVLRGLDVTIAQGSIHAIVGGNGCGKSTLLRVMAGVLKPERGRVSNNFIAHQALMPQDPKALFACDTVADELHEWQASCGYGEEAIEHTMERFSLIQLGQRHPYDISGGQQQNLALAKLFLTEPSLLLLDEPVKGLDTVSKLAVAHALRECADQGITIALVTHDLAFAFCVADIVTMIFDGEVACTEPSHQFFEGNLFYRPEPCEFTHLFMGNQPSFDGEDSMHARGSRVSVGMQHLVRSVSDDEERLS